MKGWPQMASRIRCSRSAALAIALTLPAFGQLGGLLKGKKDPDKEKKAEAKNQMRYDKLKEYSLDKYQNDPDFRDEVEEAYADLMREHTDRAYEKNTHRASFIMTVHEDNWRMHVNLYDNLLVQDHINRIGQKLVPAESERAFAFKVIPDPTPLAETLSTGTIYVSTGLISLLDSEAQLAYVLAHEMGHVQLDHWKERVMMDKGQEAYAEDQAKKVRRLALIGSLAGSALGGGIGRSVGGALIGAVGGAAVGAVVGSIIDRPLIVNWDRVEEDAADEFAFKAVLNASYDVREVPKLYLVMQNATVKDTRVGLGFLGSRHRIEQRIESAKRLIEQSYKADIEAKLKTGFLSTSAEHRNLMAELKRDNGIMAYYHDMFDLARRNLADAVAIRDNDSAAHYFYAKVLKLVGRTDEDQKLAREEFFKAAKFDNRNQNFGSHLHLALMMVREAGADQKQIAGEMDNYVTDYAKWAIENRALRAFPPNLDSIYEYMTLYGDPGWRPKPPDMKEFMAAYQTLNDMVPEEKPVENDPRVEKASTTSQPQPGAKNPAPVIKKTGVPLKKP
jgi:predicted Zn-dependent protease